MNKKIKSQSIKKIFPTIKKIGFKIMHKKIL